MPSTLRKKFVTEHPENPNTRTNWHRRIKYRQHLHHTTGNDPASKGCLQGVAFACAKNW